eukprot:Selendium_serpulae@DN4219_c0_g1_i1.p1
MAAPAVESEPLTEDTVKSDEKKVPDAASPKPTADSSVPATLKEKEKLLERKKRFGSWTEDEKKKARAERFTAATISTESAAETEEKRKKRAERFGTTTPALEEDKRKTRAARFGTMNPDLEADKKAQRSARFSATASASSSESGPSNWSCDPELGKMTLEERKQLRAARFRT